MRYIEDTEHRYLPSSSSIAQLVGWTTFELVIMREGTTAIGQQAFGLDLSGSLGMVLITLFWGAILMALLRRVRTTLDQ